MLNNKSAAVEHTSGHSSEQYSEQSAMPPHSVTPRPEDTRDTSARDAILIATQQEIADADAALDTILNIIARRAQEITNAQAAVIELLDGDEMVYRAATGTAQSYVGLRLKAEGSMSGLCVREGGPLTCVDSETDKRVDRDACRRVGARSMVVVPLTQQRVTQGVLKVYTSRPDAFGAHDVTALQLMTGMIVAGMSSAAMQDARQALAVSEERQRLAVESAHVGTFHWNLADDILVWSDKCKELYGLAPDACAGYDRFLAILHPDDAAQTHQTIQDALDARAPIAVEYRCVWPDGSVHWISAQGRVFTDAQGRPSRMEGVAVDITARKDAEAVMRRQRDDLQALNRRMQRAMTETHHRVKNNLQMISALIEIQALDHVDDGVSGEFDRLNSHIRAMAAVHDLLTQQARRDGEANYVSARAVLAKMLPLIESMAGGPVLKFRVQDARISGKQGISLALITNELALNALKHGCRALTITFEVQEQTAVLEVRDDGPGFPDDFKPTEAANTGLFLVESIGRLDLGGDVRYGRGPDGTGGRVTITMPLENLLPDTLK